MSGEPTMEQNIENIMLVSPIYNIIRNRQNIIHHSRDEMLQGQYADVCMAVFINFLTNKIYTTLHEQAVQKNLRY